MFAICVEASQQRGMGHLFRGLALARALEDRGAQVLFYANDDPGVRRALALAARPWTPVPLRNAEQRWVSERIRGDGVRVWIDDCFETSEEHARSVLSGGARLATFNDSGPGAALADLHISAVRLGERAELRGRKILSGLQYMVLDPEVRLYRRPRSEVRSLVVSMGGSDTYGLTVQVMSALQARGKKATVVIGPGFAHEAALASLGNQGFIVKRSLSSLPQEFSRHDLAITAGGVTPFEANAAGLPCVVIGAEPWEERAGRLLADLGGCVYAGARHAIDFSILDRSLPIGQMSEAALASVPADGADRVAAELMAL